MKKGPFLTIMTRVYKRPNSLLTHLLSAYNQTDKDFDHVVMVDDKGIGVGQTHLRFAENVHRVSGDYVLILDDDDMFVSDKAIETLKDIAVDDPDMIIFQCDHKELGILPYKTYLEEGLIPPRGRMGSCAYITKSELFAREADKFVANYDGDYDFFESVFNASTHIVFLETVLTGVQRISRGKIE